MTKLLIRLFIRDPANIQDRTVRTAYGNLACMVGIVCNVLLFAGKFTVGTLFGSMAIAADALNNLSAPTWSAWWASAWGQNLPMMSTLTAMHGTNTWRGWRFRS